MIVNPNFTFCISPQILDWSRFSTLLAHTLRAVFAYKRSGAADCAGKAFSAERGCAQSDLSAAAPAKRSGAVSAFDWLRDLQQPYPIKHRSPLSPEIPGRAQLQASGLR